jgi:hypothetical protein
MSNPDTPLPCKNPSSDTRHNLLPVHDIPWSSNLTRLKLNLILHQNPTHNRLRDIGPEEPLRTR